jgi:hypothetical protein
VAAIAISEVPFKVAQLKGFYREEGLDVEMIQSTKKIIRIFMDMEERHGN